MSQQPMSAAAPTAPAPAAHLRRRRARAHSCPRRAHHPRPRHPRWSPFAPSLYTVFAAASLFAAFSALPAPASATAASSVLPSLDFDQLGSAALVGAFSGLEPWSGSSRARLSDSASLLARAPNGTLLALADTNPGGSISALCEMPGFVEQSAELYAAGNFSTIAGVPAAHIARWQPFEGHNGTWTALAAGVTGPVQALYCDVSHRAVVAGGDFPGSLSIWNTSSSEWESQPYPDLDGPVFSVSAGQNPDTTHLAGGFSVQFHTPGAGGNRSASPLSSALRPVSLAGASIQADAVGSGNPADLLCPQADDGANGGTFLWPDGSAGSLTVNLFHTEASRAIRVGNTFANDRGSGNFSLKVSTSDDPIPLIYSDTSTGLNATCTTTCPLSHNPTIPYQDFIFADADSSPTGTVDVSSFTISVDSWMGAGPGLHLLQLLGPGASAHANRGYNRARCESNQPGAGSFTAAVTTTGGWRHHAYSTGANTTEGYLSLARSATSQGTIAFSIDVLVDGNYTFYAILPGCNDSGTCGNGGAMSTRINFNSSVPAVTANIPAPGSEEESVLLYDGPVAAPTGTWQPSVTMSVDLSPQKAQVIGAISRVDAVLRNSSALPPASVRGFGLLDANIYKPLPNTTVVTNVTTGILDAASAGLSASALTAPSYVATYAIAGDQVLVGGSFNGTTSANATSAGTPFLNLIVMVPPANSTASANASRYEAMILPGGGTSGPVLSLLATSSGVFVGGNFTSTADGKTQLTHAARFDVASDSWDALDGGLPGPVTAIHRLGVDSIMFLGSFPLSSTGGAFGLTTGTFAIWNLTTKAWVSQHALVEGSLSAALSPEAATPQGMPNATYLAGHVSTIAAQSAPGAVSLGPVPSGQVFPSLRPLNYTLDPTSTTAAEETKAAAVRRARMDYAAMLARWTAALKGAARRPMQYDEDDVKAATTDLVSRATASTLPAPTGDVRAAAFWKGPRGAWMLLGGQFKSGNATNLAKYPVSRSDGGSSDSDSESGSSSAEGSARAGDLVGVTSFPSGTLGTVQSLAVVNDSVYVGSAGGLNMYNLTMDAWEENIAPLGANEDEVVVRRVLLRPSTTTLIVAGQFDTAGSLPCSGICLLDTDQHRWSQAPGLTGNVTDVAFAENKANTLVVAGSLEVGGVHAALAGWHFGNSSWTAYGSIGASLTQAPGPAAALAVDDYNAAHIIIAGDAGSSSTDPNPGSSANPYLAVWSGNAFSILDGGASNKSAQLMSGTQISQLTVLPLTKSRNGANGALERDRVLLIGGSLHTSAYGLLGAMLFDGANGWTPWLKAVASPGSTGSAGVRALAYATTHALRFASAHHMAVGVVICISIFIGLGIVLILVILALLLALILRRRLANEPSPFAVIGNSAANRAARKQVQDNASRSDAGALLNTLEAATERVLALAPTGPARKRSRRSPEIVRPTSNRSRASPGGLSPSRASSQLEDARRAAALQPGEGEQVFFIGAAPVHSGYEKNEAEAVLGARGAHIKSWHGMPEAYEPGNTSGSGHDQSPSPSHSAHGGSAEHRTSSSSHRQGSMQSAGSVLAGLPERIISEDGHDPTHGYRSSESSTAAAWRQSFAAQGGHLSDGTETGYGSGYNTSSGYATGTGTGTATGVDTSRSGTGRGSGSATRGRDSTSGYATRGSGPTGSGRGQGHQTSTSGETGYLLSTDSGRAPIPPATVRTLLKPAGRQDASVRTSVAEEPRQHDTGESGHNASGEYSSGAVYTTDSSAPRVGPGFGATGARFPSDESDAESETDPSLRSTFQDAAMQPGDGPGDDGHFTAHARYDYIPTSSAELPLAAGQEIRVLQSDDPDWWLAQNDSGQTGVVPAGYLL